MKLGRLLHFIMTHYEKGFSEIRHLKGWKGVKRKKIVCGGNARHFVTTQNTKPGQCRVTTASRTPISNKKQYFSYPLSESYFNDFYFIQNCIEFIPAVGTSWKHIVWSILDLLCTRLGSNKQPRWLCGLYRLLDCRNLDETVIFGHNVLNFHGRKFNIACILFTNKCFMF